MPPPEVKFAVRYPAGSGAWRYEALDIPNPGGSFMPLEYLPAAGDLVTLWDRSGHVEGGPHFRVVARSWSYSGYGSVNWPYGQREPSSGPLVDIIVEPAGGPYSDVDQLLNVRRLASEMHDRAGREQDRRIAGIYGYLGRAIDFHASEVPPVTSDDPGLVREILEALCRRDGLPLTSLIDVGGGNSIFRAEPARNYELAIRLGIGEVFGVPGQ